MTLEKFLSGKLQKFSLLDLGLVKIVYFIVGLLIISLFKGLQGLHWGYFLALVLMSVMPLLIHLFSLKGQLFFDKYKAYLKTNNPSNQVLLFMYMFAFAGFLGQLFPILISYDWFVYVILMIVFSIKPLTVTWFW